MLSRFPSPDLYIEDIFFPCHWFSYFVILWSSSQNSSTLISTDYQVLLEQVWTSLFLAFQSNSVNPSFICLYNSLGSPFMLWYDRTLSWYFPLPLHWQLFSLKWPLCFNRFSISTKELPFVYYYLSILRESTFSTFSSFSNSVSSRKMLSSISLLYLSLINVSYWVKCLKKSSSPSTRFSTRTWSLSSVSISLNIPVLLNVLT